MVRSASFEPAPPILELRQYLLHRGRRDELIDLFNAEFIEAQESAGIRVIGQFRDIDRPNHFVWLRGFEDHETRRTALTAFYEGPVWAKHGPAAGALMIDSDDVHQLRVHRDPASQLVIRTTDHRDTDEERGVVVIVVAHRRHDREASHDDQVRGIVIPRLVSAGLPTAGLYETDTAANPFPRLPIRAANALVWIGTGEDLETLDAAAYQLSLARRELAASTVREGLDEIQLDVLRLEPTARSCITHAAPH